MRRRLPSSWLATAAVVAVLGVALQVTGAPAVCDALKPTSDKLGYRDRGNRCEGLYIAPLAGSQLELVSLFRGSLSHALSPQSKLIVSAPDVKDFAHGPVRVRAVAQSIKTYYRMDAVLASDPLSWPLREVLEPLPLPPSRLGIVGWVEVKAGKLFVPLQVVSDEHPATGPVRMLVRSSVDADDIQWRVSDGSYPPPQWMSAMNHVPAGTSVPILLPDGARQVLLVEVAAKRRGLAEWSKLRLSVIRALR